MCFIIARCDYDVLLRGEVDQGATVVREHEIGHDGGGGGERFRTALSVQFTRNPQWFNVKIGMPLYSVLAILLH